MPYYARGLGGLAHQYAIKSGGTGSPVPPGVDPLAALDPEMRELVTSIEPLPPTPSPPPIERVAAFTALGAGVAALGTFRVLNPRSILDGPRDLAAQWARSQSAVGVAAAVGGAVGLATGLLTASPHPAPAVAAYPTPDLNPYVSPPAVPVLQQPEPAATAW